MDMIKGIVLILLGVGLLCWAGSMIYHAGYADALRYEEQMHHYQ